MADGTSRSIDQVKPGDAVADATPTVAEGTEDQTHTVTGTHVTVTDRNYVDVTVATADGSKTIVGTAHHLYWDATSRSWTPASDLRVGHRLQTSEGATVLIVELRAYVAHMATYNLSVDKVHTFYVLAGATPVLVHNCPTGGFVRRFFVPKKTDAEIADEKMRASRVPIRLGEIADYDLPDHGDKAKIANAEGMHDARLIEAINDPDELGGSIVLGDREVLQGNHRIHEALKRMRNPAIELITPETEILVVR
jgi:hypothetical protein